MTSNPYELRRSTSACAATGQALSPGDVIIAALVEREGEEGFDRVDALSEQWEGGWRPERLFAHWRTVVPTSDARPNPFIDDDALLDLFDSLADSDETDHRRLAFRHLLALVLVRKRLLIQIGAGKPTESGSRAILVKRRGAPQDAPPDRVLAPEITPELVGDLTQQLAGLLTPEV